jgi:hypothetical protein
VAPTEFWKMHPNHFWWLYEMKVNRAPSAQNKNLRNDDLKRLYEKLKASKKES